MFFRRLRIFPATIVAVRSQVARSMSLAANLSVLRTTLRRRAPRAKRVVSRSPVALCRRSTANSIRVVSVVLFGE